MKRAIVLAVVLMCAHLGLATTIHVPADQPSIQAGIDASVDGDTVLVADGHYYERINYRGKNIVLGSSFLIDGDTMHIANTIIDGDITVLGVSDSGSVVSFLNGEDSSSILSGVTIQKGVGLKHPADRQGGGIICIGASPRIESCSFVDNHASWGGAVFSDLAATRIRDCLFINNSANIYGGALFSWHGAIKIEGCGFVENRATFGGGAVMSMTGPAEATNSYFLRNKATHGGAINAWGAMTISGCRFNGDSADVYGGAIHWDSPNSLSIANCVFTSNFAPFGGAICVGGVFKSTAIAGCTFRQNHATWGGAIYVPGSPTGALLDRSAFDGNTATNEGGALLISSGRVSIRSCSFVRNFAPVGSFLGNHMNDTTNVPSDLQDCLVAFNYGGSIVDPTDVHWLMPALSCSNIYGNSAGDWISYLASQANSNGNLSSDPLFCDTAAGDFHLQSNSPCAPANNSCGVLIGAMPVACAWGCGDIDGSGGVNVTDAVRLIYYLFVNGSEPLDLSGGDVNQDGRLNIADVVYLMNYIFIGGPEPCAAGE